MLADKSWQPISIHEVALAWLRGERHGQTAQQLRMRNPKAFDRLLDEPDLSLPDQNRSRLRLWYRIRLPLIAELPPDTNWYRVDSLTDLELDELHALRSAEWLRSSNESALRQVAQRKAIPLTREPEHWETPILFAHDRDGPFTVIEGNHRLAAYAASGQTGLAIPVMIGLSPLGCFWHAPSDRQRSLLLRDLVWPKNRPALTA